MRQIEEVMRNRMGVLKKNIFYLTGRSKIKNKNVQIEPTLWIKDPVNMIMLKNFNKGYGGENSEIIEIAITNAKRLIEKFIRKNKIDIIIAHNTSHPVNFILSVALSRYYKDAIKNKKKTPKYILWWHDSHLERLHFKNPSYDVSQYLLQGVPGKYVEYAIFINSLQFHMAQKYYKKLHREHDEYNELAHNNHAVIYNTTDIFIDSYKDIESDAHCSNIEKFLDEFKVRQLLKKNNITLSKVLFCLQHTRVIPRKRIDFALKYAFALLKRKMETGIHTKALYFLVSGNNPDGTKAKLKKLYRQLMKEYNHPKFFLVFAEENKKTNIKFEEYPIIIAKLRGFATYFSEVEGFGNNLLEVLSSGLIPIVYKYPVFKSDIEKHNFKLVGLNKYEINDKNIDKALDIIRNDRKRKTWVNKNLDILKKKFPHKVMAFKLKRAIMKKRLHP